MGPFACPSTACRLNLSSAVHAFVVPKPASTKAARSSSFGANGKNGRRAWTALLSRRSGKLVKHTVRAVFIGMLFVSSCSRGFRTRSCLGPFAGVTSPRGGKGEKTEMKGHLAAWCSRRTRGKNRIRGQPLATPGSVRSAMRACGRTDGNRGN